MDNVMFIYEITTSSVRRMDVGHPCYTCEPVTRARGSADAEGAHLCIYPPSRYIASTTRACCLEGRTETKRKGVYLEG